MITIPLEEHASFDASLPTNVHGDYYVVGDGLMEQVPLKRFYQIQNVCSIDGFRDGWKIDWPDSYSSIRPTTGQVTGTYLNGTPIGLIPITFDHMYRFDPIINGYNFFANTFDILPENLGGLDDFFHIYLSNFQSMFPKLKNLYSPSIPDVKEINMICNVKTSNLKTLYTIRFTYSLGEPIFPPVYIHAPDEISFGSITIGSNAQRPLLIDLEAETVGKGLLTFKAESVLDSNTGSIGGGSYRITTPGDDNTYVDLDGGQGVPVSYTSGTTSLSSIIKLIVPRNATTGPQNTNLNITFKQY